MSDYSDDEERSDNNNEEVLEEEGEDEYDAGNNDDNDDDNDRSSGRAQYTSDGLTDNEYSRSNMTNEGLEKSECCGRFFKKNGYEHRKYGLSIPGVKTCIHCYISINTYKFVDLNSNEKLTKPEEDCLRFYIKNFVTEHNTNKCMRTQHGGRCLLCNATLGIYPPFIANEMLPKIETHHTSTITMSELAINDIIVVEPLIKVSSSNSSAVKFPNSNASNQFVLVL